MANEAGFGREAEQRLDHGERDQFGVAELWGDPDNGSFGSPVGVINQQIVDSDVESGRERVQVRVHASPPRQLACTNALIMGALALYVVVRADRANPLELLA